MIINKIINKSHSTNVQNNLQDMNSLPNLHIFSSISLVSFIILDQKKTPAYQSEE